MRPLFHVLLVTLAACGTAEPPAAAPPPAATPAPATPAPATPAAPAATLPPLVDEAIGRVLGLIADPNDAAIKAAFSPTFLAAVAQEKIKAILTGVKTDVGACKERRPVEVKSDTAALVRLQCQRGAVHATVTVNAAPPHFIEGLLLKPAP
jgi:hypothetical protein